MAPSVGLSAIDISPLSGPHQTPLQEAVSFIAIGAILVAVACYIAAQQNLPFASPRPLLGCFNSLPRGPRFGRCKCATDANAGGRGSDWSQLFCCERPICRSDWDLVLERADRKDRATDREAPA